MLRSFVTAYASFTGLAALGIARTERSGVEKPEEELPSIAVVVAARDEETNLPALIAALATQDYPTDRISFWIVDDDSSDRTYSLVQRAQQRDDRFHALKSPATGEIASPKKRALDTGIRAADADWIVTTDADCRPGPNWLRALAGFMNEATGVVLGYSPLVGGREAGQILLMGESYSAGVLSAAGAGLGMPFNAVGRNLAFRRRLYLDIGGYGLGGDIASGDDDLLVQRIASTTDWNVRFCGDFRSFVEARVPPPGRAFNTKVRHMAVGPRYAPGWVAVGAVGSALFMGLALATVLAWLGLVNRKKVWTAWRWKWLLDLILAVSANRLFGQPARAALAIATMSFAPFALWAIWPRALFGTVRWKGRSYERNRARQSDDEGAL